MIESIDIAADLVQIEQTVRPDPAAAAVYAELRPVFIELYNALVPAFTSLRRLAPGLPIRFEETFGGSDTHSESVPPKAQLSPPSPEET